jgi:DNA polymerase III subunit epsilon
MRYIVLDTETTGLDPKQGHRIIEIAGVEVVDRRPTGRHVHYYLNPEREIDAGATDVHGLTWESLRDKPKFGDIAGELLEFARGAHWVIHNAAFDLAFLDEELGRLGLPVTAAIYAEVIDTLALAREQFPGKKNALDALCERFGVANTHRTLHGALLDAQLLAEVYLAMTRGQESLTINLAPPVLAPAEAVSGAALPAIRILGPTPEELAAHRSYLAELDREARGRCIWLALDRTRYAAPSVSEAAS